MNERGFTTIIGICFLLAICIVIRGFAETEENHSYETTSFQAKKELQNFAESAFLETLERVRESPALVPAKGSWLPPSARQVNISAESKISEIFGEVKFTAWGVRGDIVEIIRSYQASSAEKFTDSDPENIGKGVYIICVAESKSERLKGKIFGSVRGYFLTNPDDAKLYLLK